MSAVSRDVYDLIVRRFLSIFYPPAVYQKVSDCDTDAEENGFFPAFRVLAEEGYLKAAGDPEAELPQIRKRKSPENETQDKALFERVQCVKKGDILAVKNLEIKEGETSHAPKRYNSGSIILAMENAGQLIEDEELRAQIKGSGIGTSATRAEILKKLIHIKYLALSKKTQIITPTLQGRDGL